MFSQFFTGDFEKNFPHDRKFFSEASRLIFSMIQGYFPGGDHSILSRCCNILQISPGFIMIAMYLFFS